MYVPFTHEELHERFEEIRKKQMVNCDNHIGYEVTRAILNDLTFSYENEISAHERLDRLSESAAPKEV